MRLLWSLPRAAPALLRHLMGYAELATQDLEQTQRDLAARITSAIVLAFSLFFVIFSGCLLLIALTWDTPHRVPAIGWMLGFFVASALISWGYRSNAARLRQPFLATVRSEWREDRVILDHILSSDEE